MKAVSEELNSSLSGIDSRFRVVKNYYANNKTGKEVLIPYTDYNTAYVEIKRELSLV